MPTPLVLITEPLSKEPLNWLADRCQIKNILTTDQHFNSNLAQAQALIVRTYTTVDQALLDQAPNLKVIARAGVGLDNIDLKACAARAIPVVHTPHSNAMAVVEYTISMLLQSLRPIAPITKSLTDAQWRQTREHAITPNSVVGSTLGILGLGHIGARVATAAHALGMKVQYHDLRSIPPEQAKHAQPVTLKALLQTSQALCIHVDGRSENNHLISQPQFDLMPHDVTLINASRGFVIDPAAAASFARHNPHSRLILDVHDPEPIEPHSELLNLDNVILTPHIAAATTQAKAAMSWVVRDVWAILSGQTPTHQANKA